MKTFRNLILSIVVGGVVSISATTSRAAIYNYSFSNSFGNTDGTIAGAIILADGDGVNLEALAVTITHAPVAFDLSSPIEFMSQGTVYENEFTVTGGQITGIKLILEAETDVGKIALNLQDYQSVSYTFIGQNIYNVGTSAPADINLSAVPLPAALPLYGAGIAVMGFIGLRSKRKT